MFNKVVLVGNLTRDIELRYIQTGTAVGRTGIAVTRVYNSNGEKKEETCFIDLNFFGRTAEIAGQYLSKGSKILVEGRLKFEQWTDQNGQNRNRHSISVESMEMLGSNQSQGGNNSYQQNQNSYNNQNYNPNQDYNQKNNYQSQNNQMYQNKQIDNFNKIQQNNIPDVDVDADKYDVDETIPF